MADEKEARSDADDQMGICKYIQLFGAVGSVTLTRRECYAYYGHSPFRVISWTPLQDQGDD